ncbi:HIT domain-containing protein [Sphingomonas sp. BIUV-7]|uniref:HIT domain-containing protein n=1 Tax=Sphingomonas natans TaxID=3063330 RepID=A0ABT8Y9C6_9SPHN|nr:HIT domain-containing protein [Sphingomonas sp. BIUV-7]MDO6414255.1 HIT domain-containing protein [Sphingomonas sp. BIUV-7]
MKRLVMGYMMMTAIGAATATSAQTKPPVSANSGATLCPLSAPYDANNPCARIIQGQLPVSIIAQNKRVIAIIPLDWVHPNHALVMPKRPVRNLYDLDDRDLVAVMHMVKRVATAQQRAVGSTGFSLQQNNASSQDVCHLHVHVIPNTPLVPRVRATRAEMDAMAE